MGRGLRHCRPYEEYEFDDISVESIQRRKRQASSVSSGCKDSDSEFRIGANYCGSETNYPKMFGVLFPNRSFPMDASSFTQIDPTHWVMSLDSFVGESYDQVKELCIFLLNEFSLPPDKALAVYVQSPGSEFQYCGAVHRSCPSTVLALLWPNPGGQMQLMSSEAPPLSAKIGLAVEDLISLPAVNVGRQQQFETLAMKVGENLFNFVQSFCSVEGNKLMVPMDILNQWFRKFQEKTKRDPDYLKNSVA